MVYTSCDLRNVLNERASCTEPAFASCGRDRHVCADDWVKIGTETVVIAHPFTDKVGWSPPWMVARVYCACHFMACRTHSSFKFGEGDDNVDETANDGLRCQSLQTRHGG